MLRWVFLDIGNVVMNDDPAMALLYRELHQMMCSSGYRIPFPELLTEREELIRKYGPEHWQILGRKYLGDDGHWKLMLRCASKIRADYMASHAVLPEMGDAVRTLAERYRIGVVANQLREVVGALEEIGLGACIKVHAISEIVGLRKPSPELYRWALDRAECEPREAVMVGDRVDNDIAPARQIGMWTVLFQMPHEAKGYVPKGDLDRLYYESQLRASICRIPPTTPEQTPDERAESARELLMAIERIHQRAEAPSEDQTPRR
jgi:HAD superfamily hydrolase (TIGR01662 family)